MRLPPAGATEKEDGMQVTWNITETATWPNKWLTDAAYWYGDLAEARAQP
jgi:hypothetical protein